MAGRIAVLTICSANYVHLAKTLAASIEATNPGYRFFLVLVDECPQELCDSRGLDVIPVGDLPLPDRQKFLFRYTIMELNTAVKPWAMEYVLDQGFDRVIYLDPDIKAYSRFEELERAFDEGADIVLTPHLTGQLDDDKYITEQHILQAGSWNLGFVGVSESESARAFLRWWQSKLEFRCVVDFENGLFVDQKWVDLVPGMFPNVFNLRHEGYNVAYWNLKHRAHSVVDGEHRFNDQPLRFFHFSALDPFAPARFSKHQNRFTLSDLGRIAELVHPYCTEVIANGAKETKGIPYAYGVFGNGAPILDAMRVAYRNSPKLIEQLGADPFAADPYVFDGVIEKETPIRTFLKLQGSAFDALLRPCARKCLPAPVKRMLRAIRLRVVPGAKDFWES